MTPSNPFRRALVSGVFLSLISFPGMAAPPAPILVTNASDSGAGTLRAALAEAAAAETASQIVIATEGDIETASSLVYDGRAPLVLIGEGQTVKTMSDETILAATAGADLTIRGLNFQGPGGYSIQVQGAPGGKGIFLDLREDQTGTVALVLDTVTVSDVARHGVHVSDCDLADACGGGGGGAGGGSAASVSVTLTDVTIRAVGLGGFDADGLRVDERGAGDIRFVAFNSTFEGVGADGVELDEGQAGDIIVAARGSAFNDNGAYCDPNLLAPFLPEIPEAEFEDGAMAESAIPGPVTGTPDDRCVEREVDLYDSGMVEAYEFGIDLDDGFDIDEAGPGDLRAILTGSVIDDNLDEGIDFDEEDAGDIIVSFVETVASGNRDDGFKISEVGDGDVRGVATRATAKNNGGVGLVFEEEDAGSVHVLVRETVTAANDDGAFTGIEIVQDGDGEGLLTVNESNIADGVTADGAEVAP